LANSGIGLSNKGKKEYVEERGHGDRADSRGLGKTWRRRRMRRGEGTMRKGRGSDTGIAEVRGQ